MKSFLSVVALLGVILASPASAVTPPANDVLARDDLEARGETVTVTRTIHPITILTPCAGHPPVDVTELDQLITSCTTTYSTASMLATKAGD
jgi:hypothetical protein